MPELMFYPEDGINERAEIHAEYAEGRLRTDRIVGKVNSAAAPTPDVSPHPRLTRGRHLDELQAVEEAVDGYLRELRELAARRQEIEAEIRRARGIYRQLVSAAAIVGGFLLLVLILVVLILVLTRH